MIITEGIIEKYIFHIATSGDNRTTAVDSRVVHKNWAGTRDLD